MKNEILIVLVISLLLKGCTGTVPKLGVENGKLKQCPETPNCVNSQAEDKTHSIEPISVDANPHEAKNLILKALNELKQARIVVADDHYIRAEFVSKVFRFVDDVEFYFPGKKSKELLIQVRSASRVGHSDLGVNRKRVEQIRQRFKTITTSHSGGSVKGERN